MRLQASKLTVRSLLATSFLTLLVLLFGAPEPQNALAEGDPYEDHDGDGIPEYKDCNPYRATNHIVDPDGFIETGAGYFIGGVHDTLQAAVIAANDGDVISVYAHTVENVVIGASTGSGAKNLRIIGCKNLYYAGTLIRAPKVEAADSRLPVIRIESTAGASGVNTGVGERHIHIEALDVLGASGAPGYLVETSMSSRETSTLLDHVRSNGNDVGVLILGDDNEIRGAVNIGGNASFGVRVIGNGNRVGDSRVERNNGRGIGVESDGNVLSKNKVTLNVLDGIYVIGHNNLLYQNDLTANGRHGINADSANGASDNDLDGNDGRENALQGIRACGQNDLGDNTGQENGVSPQVDFICAEAGPASPATFFVADNQNDKVYKYDASGVPVDAFNLSGGNNDPSGVAVAGRDVYVLDKRNKRVYRYTDSGGTPTVSRILKEGGGGNLGKPTGLALDGDELWLVDDGKKKSYRYSLAQAFSGSASLNAAQEIAFTGRNGSAEGLAIDGIFLYVLDDSSRQFYRYPRAGGQGTASRTMRRVDGGALGTPAGAKLDGSSVWVVDKSNGKVCEYALGSLFSGTGNLNAVSEFALTSSNGDAQGL